MTRKAKLFVFEGTEGVGKTTQTNKLVQHLQDKGFKVLQTKEPGTPLAPLTMELRNVMLNAKYEPELTTVARELISQAIRSIHLEKVILPALNEYDYIIQDRGLLSGLAYGHACGNSLLNLNQLIGMVVANCFSEPYYELYDKVIYLKGNVTGGLNRALNAKQEFEAGDAIEAKGSSFMEKVSSNMDEMVKVFPHVVINVDEKSVEENFEQILSSLDLEA